MRPRLKHLHHGFFTKLSQLEAICIAHHLGGTEGRNLTWASLHRSRGKRKVRAPVSLPTVFASASAGHKSCARHYLQGRAISGIS